MNASTWEARVEVARACRRLAAAGLVHGTNGNVSARVQERGQSRFLHVAITPTGAVLGELDPEQVTVVDQEGKVVLEGALAPTSELGLHLGVYERFGAGAVVHTHAPTATALACVLEGELPCVHYEMLALGGSVRIAPYATFGTPELHDGVLEALQDRTAALMANHGTLAFGVDLAQAVRNTELLEWACTVYWRAAALGSPKVLDAEQQQAVVAAVIERGYGSTKPA